MGKSGLILVLIFIVGVLLAFVSHWNNFAKERGFETIDSIVDKQKLENNILR